MPNAGNDAGRTEDLIRRLRGLRANYAVRAKSAPNPPLSWGDAVEDLDDVLAALDGLTWTERRDLTRVIPPVDAPTATEAGGSEV